MAVFNAKARRTEEEKTSGLRAFALKNCLRRKKAWLCVSNAISGKRRAGELQLGRDWFVAAAIEIFAEPRRDRAGSERKRLESAGEDSGAGGCFLESILANPLLAELPGGFGIAGFNDGDFLVQMDDFENRARLHP
jgi:hypothetical protein